MNRLHVDILVLGAGLQGAGVALALASRGVAVHLVDQDSCALNRASLRNEGKIHLGFIYAKDATRATAFLQADGAFRFRRIVSAWTPDASVWASQSTPFHYLVAGDSIVSPGTLAEHYDAVGRRCREVLTEAPELDYLGARHATWVRPLRESEIGACFDASRFAAGFATAERAIDTVRLASALRAAIEASANVVFHRCHTVRAISEASTGFLVEGDAPGGAWAIHARQVVNATWERRHALDAMLGIAPPSQLLHRLKFRVIARLPHALHGAPSVSMVLGRYGDVVVRSDGTAYLSWYPAGLQGWSGAIEPPRDWDAACRGAADPASTRGIAREILSAIDAWYPGIGSSEVLEVDAGAIVAIGNRDVDDPSSQLHDRTRIGVFSRGGYHSVDPGKLTTAPLFAVAAADRVIEWRESMGAG